MAVVWGAEASNSNGASKIGIDVYAIEETNQTIKFRYDIWYWTKWAVDDVGNTFRVSLDGENFQTYTNIAIKHTTNSSWSNKNKTPIGSWDLTHTKEHNAKTLTAKATFSDVEYGGGSGSVSVNYTIPQLKYYTVSYNANGGTGAPASQTKWHGENITLSKSIPTRNGYSFLGWGTTKDATQIAYESGDTYGVDSNITLYAMWEANLYSVSYNANGGSNAPASQWKTHGVDLTLSSTIPTRTNYKFMGWATAKNTTTVSYNAGAVYKNNANITLYAIWTLDYERPTITNFTATRVDEIENEADNGNFIKVKFNWSTWRESALFALYFKLTTEDEEAYQGGYQIALEGTSGEVEVLLRSSTGSVQYLDEEYSYNIKLNVADSGGYSSSYALIPSLFMTIDVTENGKSMTFGAPTPEEDGYLGLAFKTVEIKPSEKLLYHGENFFGGRLIWSGDSLMNETHSITLDKNVSDMKNGLLLVFSRNGTYNITPCFIPKDVVALYGRTSYTFPLVTSLFDYVGQKTIYVSDTKIEGHADNDNTGKNATSGITYHNEAFYLKNVYEV
jgi:uncharacterized repeat protein (TIGR02543 family)